MLCLGAVLVLAFHSLHVYGINKPYVTVLRTDGFGAQLQERITCLIQSRVTPGLTYVHTPLKDLDHLRPASWRVFQDLEDFVNLGQGELRPEDVPKDQMEVLEGCAAFVNGNIGLLELFRGELHLKYKSNKGCAGPRIQHLHHDIPQLLQVHVHIRRGDVDEANRDKWMDMSHHLRTMQKVAKAAHLVQMSTSVHVHSEGNITEFTEIAEAFNAKLHLNEQMTASWKAMTEADVLVMSRSSFSYTAALYNQAGVIIYSDMRPSEPLPSWLEDSASVEDIADRLQHIKIFRNLGTL